MNRKIRCDSKLHGLPVEQRVKVGVWLFEEGFTYKEVVEACLSEFGLQVSKSSVGRYYERISADRFAKVQREKRMALLPELSPAEAYEVLLWRIGTIALELMDEEVVNSKLVVILARVLLAARREKHMATRVWVERRKAENWMAREVLRHWRRTRKKTAHVSYLPIWPEGRVVSETPTTATETVAIPGNRRSNAQRERDVGCDDQDGRNSQNTPPLPDVLKGGVGFVENEGSAGALNPTREGACAPRKAGGTDMSANGGQRSASPTIGCKRNRRDAQSPITNEAKSGRTNPLYVLSANSFALASSH